MPQISVMHPLLVPYCRILSNGKEGPRFTIIPSENPFEVMVKWRMSASLRSGM